MAPPHAAAKQQLLLTPLPALSEKTIGERLIIESGDQHRRVCVPLDALQQSWKSLFQAGIPGQVAQEFELIPATSLSQLQATGKNGIVGEKHTTARPRAIQQIKPVAIGDLTQVTETASQLNRPEQLGRAAVDRLPAQTLG